jgi:hypothetical protein
MEQLKVKKRDTIIGNTITYLLLSFLFLYLQYAYRHHLSPFSWIYLRKGAELFWYVAFPVIISCVLIWKHHRYARIAFCISLFTVGFKVVEGLFIEFNKVIVVALFFYSVISFFLYQLLAEYLSLASLNPNYSSSDLFDPLLQKIPCTVEVNEQVKSGYLTNWDHEGCFVKLSLDSIPQSVIVTVHFHERDFIQMGEVVSHAVDLSSFGIKFNKTPKNLKVFNWTEFIELIDELGFQPDRLR